MRRFITTEAKRNTINRAWNLYDRTPAPNMERKAMLRRWIEDAVALADGGDDLPPVPKQGEYYEP